MKLYGWRLLLTMAWSCHLLIDVSGRGEEEDEQVRPSAEWLDEFYSDIDNVLVEASLTPKASDLPDLQLYVPPLPTNNTGDSKAELTTTKPPEIDDGRKLGRLQQQDLLQGQAIGLNILYNAQGVTFQGVAPPDTAGDVGTNHYVQMTNSASGGIVRVLNKNNGSLNKTFVLDGLGVGGVCVNGRGDPIVLFDQFASRWFLSEFSSFGNTLCVYISTSDDASGTYYRYEFPAPNFPDYPKYGVWNDAYYIGTNEDTRSMYALERSKMLIGHSARMVRNAGPPPLMGFPFDMIPPVDADGDIPPPPNGPGLFVRHVDDESHSNYVDNPSRDLFEIYTLAVNFESLTTTLTLLQTIEVAEFDSKLCGLSSFFCAAQPGWPSGSTRSLDPLREVVMNRPQYRNFGTHETMVVTWVTDIDGNDQHGIRWMELRKEAGASSWTVRQQNNFSPDSTTNRWMSSIAMNKCGDIALGYSVSSLSVSPGLRLTGRLSIDPLNQLDAETALIDGVGSSSSNRWGDYAAMAVDPVDDYTFWFTSEYIPANNGQWSTRIVKFTLGTECPDIIASPTDGPTAGPTSPPSSGPTAGPTSPPSSGPTAGPTAEPTSPPSSGPTAGPVAGPTSPPGSGPKDKITCGIVRRLLGIC